MDREMKLITLAVAQHYGVPYERMVATRVQRERKWKNPYLVEARSVAMALIRECIKASYPQIARFFHMDHTTIMAACERISARVPSRAETVVDRMLFAANSPHVGHA
jgi:chromosomal replication initiation ATPase DnaA